MSDTRQEDVTALCRICLQYSEDSASIYDHDSKSSQMLVFEKIEQCADIKILPDPELPTRICKKCYAFLTIAYKFRVICKNADSYLKRFVSKTTATHTTDHEDADADLVAENGHINESVSPDQNSNADIINNEIEIEYEQVEEYDESWLEYENASSAIHVVGNRTSDGYDDDNDGDDDSASKLETKLSTSKTLDISSDGAAVIRMKGTKKIKTEASPQPKEKLPHICYICGNTYPRKYALEAHLRRHRNERPFECEICGKAFHLNYQLTRHMPKQTGIRPYQCKYCERAFANRSTMTKHERVHRNERPYCCATCGKTFTYSSVLKVHQLTHTCEKPFSLIMPYPATKRDSLSLTLSSKRTSFSEPHLLREKPTNPCHDLTHRPTALSKKTYAVEEVRRVQFLRNGDAYCAGIILPIKSSWYKNINSLLDKIQAMLADRTRLLGPLGIIFDKQGKKINDVKHLENAEYYIVACRWEQFTPICYKVQPFKVLASPHKDAELKKILLPQRKELFYQIVPDAATTIHQSFVCRPTQLILISNGNRPRKISPFIISPRLCPTLVAAYEQITKLLQPRTGRIRHIIDAHGNKVKNVKDLYMGYPIYFTCGMEQFKKEELLILDQHDFDNIAKLVTTHGFDAKNLKNIQQFTSNTIQMGINILKNDRLWPETVRSRYKFTQQSGRGNFATVMKVKCRRTGLFYALRISEKEETMLLSYKMELDIWRQLKNPYILELFDCYEDPNYVYVITEYMTDGDLTDLLNRNTHTLCSARCARLIMQHIMTAVQYLHNKKIAHRDIKCDNVLIKLNGCGEVVKAVLTDFGFAINVPYSPEVRCGTLEYVSPEMIKGENVGLELDIWASGVMLFVLLTGLFPFQGEGDTLMQNILERNIIQLQPDRSLSPNSNDLIQRMLELDVNARATAKEVLQSDWMQWKYGK